MTTYQPAITSSAGVPIRRWRIPGGLRKAVLVVHILSAGAWVGIDIVVGVLVSTAWLTVTPSVKGAAYQALGLFAVWPMLAAGSTCLVSGVVLGMGTRWGLVRYWWVVVKLVMNVVLCALILFVLRVGMSDVAEYGRALSAGSSPELDVSFLFFPPVVSLTALSTAAVLSVFKPWGRTRGSQDVGRAGR